MKAVVERQPNLDLKQALVERWLDHPTTDMPDIDDILPGLIEQLETGQAPAGDADVYVVAVGDETLQAAFAIAEQLRDEVAGIRVELNLGGGSFKSQLKRADKSRAEYALILGEQEIADRRAGLKPLRSTEDQTSVAFEELSARLAELLGKA